MANEHFEIDLDHARRFLRITLHGNWTCHTVDRYRDTVRTTVEEMISWGCALGDVGILIDTRELAVQTKDVADYYRAEPIYSAARPRRVATIIASRLVGMQVRRVGTGIQEIFDDEQEAMDWLFGP